jgi:hypothetical protein
MNSLRECTEEDGVEKSAPRNGGVLGGVLTCFFQIFILIFIIIGSEATKDKKKKSFVFYQSSPFYSPLCPLSTFPFAFPV